MLAYAREVNLKRSFGRTGSSSNCKKEYSCASCNEVRICTQHSGVWEEKIVFGCNSTTPYCDYATGTCSSDPSLECAPTDKFICMRDGAFPDPSDCKQYHVCYNYTSYSYKCDKNYYNYDSDSEQCVYGASCYTFSCSGKSGVKVAYGNDASIFAYCIYGSAYLVDRCPGNYELSSSRQACLPKCNSERLIPDVDDCTKYYKCSKESTSSYTLTHEDCPHGSGFDPIYNRCVPLSSLPECK